MNKTPNAQEAWLRSLSYACQFTHQRRFTGGLLIALGRVQARAAAMAPIDLLCAYAMKVDPDVARHDGALFVAMGCLAARGWCRDMSLMVYRNFRLCYPQLRFDPEAHRVMSRAQLIEEYGTYGNVIADVAHDPTSQPYFDQLLHGRPNEIRARELRRVGVRVALDADRDNYMIREVQLCGLKEGEIIDMLRPVEQGDLYGYAEATKLYRDATGQEPCFTTENLDPLTDDYEEIARAAEKVWPAYGTQ